MTDQGLELQAEQLAVVILRSRRHRPGDSLCEPVVEVVEVLFHRHPLQRRADALFDDRLELLQLLDDLGSSLRTHVLAWALVAFPTEGDRADPDCSATPSPGLTNG